MGGDLIEMLVRGGGFAVGKGRSFERRIWWGPFGG
jgi:hypothetical protein